MIKKNLKSIIITSLMTILPLIYGLILWNMLPETIATHFGVNGEPDGFSSKIFTVFGIPTILFLCHLLCVIGTSLDPKNSNVSSKILKMIFWITPLISNVVMICVYLYALGKDVNIGVVITLMIGIVFIVIGNYMPKCRPNYTIGIKVPWTLDNEENWVKTHRFAGILWVIAGVLVLISGLLNKLLIIFPVIIIVAFVPIVYSYIYYVKHK